MKLIKGLRKLLKSKLSRGKRRPAAQPPPDERTTAPKNGRLTVAVVVSVLIMIGLGAINIRLIRDPSIAVKAFGPIFSSKPKPDPRSPASPTKETNDSQACKSPTEVTFYDTLKTKDEDAPGTSGNVSGTAPETGAKPGEQKSPASDMKTAGQKEESKQGRAARTPEVDSQQPLQVGVPQGESRPMTYTVQVGAFSHPAIAQEWAQKWKARGYDPVLKPVARPKTGVIYRLYLGKFTTERQADDLVRHLKSKEGINALRLMVRE